MDTISEEVFKKDEEAERGNEVDYNSNNYLYHFIVTLIKGRNPDWYSTP